MEYVDVEREAVVGKPFWETPWFAGDDELQQAVRQWIGRAVTDEYVDFGVDLSRSVERALVVSGVFGPVKNADGEVVSLLISGRDITERTYRQHDLELRNPAIEEAPIGITTADADQSDDPLIYVNEAFEHLTGYDAEDILGRNCRILQGPEADSGPVVRMRGAIDVEEGTPHIGWRLVGDVEGDGVDAALRADARGPSARHATTPQTVDGDPAECSSAISVI